MNVLLLRTNPSHLYKTAGPDLGLAYLKTALGSLGAKVRVLDFLKSRPHLPELERTLEAFGPDLIGFKVFSQDVAEVNRFAGRIAAIAPDTPLVAGGPFPTGIGRALFEVMPRFSYGFAGETERAMAPFIKALEKSDGFSQVPGLIYRSHDQVAANDQDFPKDLDALGIPDLSDTPPAHYPVDYEGNVYVPVVTTRGCPYRCAYCSAGLMNGRKIRRRSPGMVVREIQNLRDRFGVGNVCIVDDNFTLIKDHVMAVCEALARDVPDLRWRCPNGIRLDSLDEPILQAMERAGCYEVYVGIETGSEKVAADMGRATSLPVLIEKVRLIRRVTRFNILGFFMVGYPTETKKDLRQTVSLALSLPLDLASFFYFTPHVGTPIADQLQKEAGAALDWKGHYYEKLNDLPRELPARTVRFWQKYAYFRFYLRWRTVRFLLRRIQTPGNTARLLRKIAAVALDR